MMPRTSDKRSLPGQVWDLLASTQLAILLLILLAAASLFNIAVGEYLRRAVPRSLSPAEALGPARYMLLSRLGLFHPYSSWWYATLLGMLCLSLSACSLSRLKRTLRAAFCMPSWKPPEALAQLACSRTLCVHAEPDQVQARLRGVLRSRFYRVAQFADESGHSLAAQRGAIGRLGALCTHVGVVALLFGGILGARGGFSTTRYGRVGEVLDVPGRDFRVRVDSLWMAWTPDGHVQDWYSQLTVLDPDSVRTRVVEVNHPLQYQGVAVYQAFWEEEPRRIARARLAVTEAGTGKRREIFLPFGQRVPLVDSLFVEISDYAADLIVDEAGNVGSRSPSPRNPAIRLALYDGGQPVGHRWLFLYHPQMGHSPEDTFQMEWLGYDPVYVTGLQVAYNPGAPLIWLGIGIATLGVCLAFFVVPRRIWAVILSDGSGRAHVVLGGASHKESYGFAREFEAIVRALQREGSLDRETTVPGEEGG